MDVDKSDIPWLRENNTSICGVWMDEPSELGFKKAKFTVAGKDVEIEVSGFD